MVETTKSFVLSSKDKTITDGFIYIQKDKKTKEPTGKKMLGIKFLAKRKNQETGYYESYEDMIPIPLTDYSKMIWIAESEEEKILSSLGGKKLVLETKISPL